MWPGKVFGTLYYLLCKHITGCKSTFGPGCILIKHYQDLENQTGCSFSIIPMWTVETDSSKRSFKDNWNLTLHFLKNKDWFHFNSVSYPALAWRAVLKSSYLWSSRCIFHLHIYKCTRDLRRWKVWQNNIVHVHSPSFTFQQSIEMAYLLDHKVWSTYL